MIDAHCHILPGIDDGSRNLGESVEMARLLSEHGFSAVIATPHVLDRDGSRLSPELIQGKVAELTAALEREGIALKIYPGAEYLFDRAFSALVRKFHPLSRLAGSWYTLVELPMMHWPGEMLFGSTWPKDDDPPEIRESLPFLKPVVAHPERNSEVLRDYGKLHSLKQHGYHFQVNLESVVGLGGKQRMKVVKKMAKEGVVDLIGTDGHSPGGLAEVLPGFRRKTEKLLGSDLAAWVNGTLPPP